MTNEEREYIIKKRDEKAGLKKYSDLKQIIGVGLLSFGVAFGFAGAGPIAISTFAAFATSGLIAIFDSFFNDKSIKYDIETFNKLLNGEINVQEETNEKEGKSR